MKATLKKLAELTSSELVGKEDYEISGVNTLEEASYSEASFFANPRYLDFFKSSNAGVICIDKNTETEKNKNYLISDNPSLAFQKIVQFFLSTEKTLSGFCDIHKTAVIHPSAQIGKNVTILPNSTIDKDVTIQDNTFIGSNVYIGYGSSIGQDCIIHSNVTIREKCIIKNRVILQPGVVIGSCGFGYIQQKDGKYQKLDQIGQVILEDDVEIGANTCIDRARFQATIIKKGTKIDNLVQIAHNVEIGENTAIAAQTGIAGSSTIGSLVVMGGQVGITGHVNVPDNTMLATRAGVSKNLKPGKYRGSPAIDLSIYNRQYVTYKNLEKTLQKFQEKIQFLEEKIKNI
jgi:UDP-3-O-[3-hydroxymyristoyl] glucosamine N-acyltransferase